MDARNILDRKVKDARLLVNKRSNTNLKVNAINKYDPIKITINNYPQNYSSEFDDKTNFSITRTYQSTIKDFGYQLKISNFPPSVTEEDIIKLFKQLGNINVVQVIGPGLLEISYCDFSSALKALEMNSKRIEGVPLMVQALNFNNKTNQKNHKRGKQQYNHEVSRLKNNFKSKCPF